MSAISLFSGYCNFLQQVSLARGDQYSLARSLNGRHALKLKKPDLRKSIFLSTVFMPKGKWYAIRGPVCFAKTFF